MVHGIKAGLRAALILAGLASAPVLADTGRNFTIYNSNANVSIQRVWTARAGESRDPWHEVTLQYAIKPNMSSNFTMGDGDVCLYDIKVQFSDEVIQQFANVNVGHGQRVNAT